MYQAITDVGAEAGFGFLSCFSSAAEITAVTTTADVDAATVSAISSAETTDADARVLSGS